MRTWSAGSQPTTNTSYTATYLSLIGQETGKEARWRLSADFFWVVDTKRREATLLGL